MRKVSVMVILFVASVVLSETMHAGTGMNRLVSRSKGFINKLGNVGGVRHVRNFFATPEDGGYSPALKTFVAGAFALTACLGTVSISGCAARVGPVDVIMTPWGGVIIPNFTVETPTLGIATQLYDVQQHITAEELTYHSVTIDGENYRGVLISYRDGSATRTGLAYSSEALLAFSLKDGKFSFITDKPFQSPEYVAVKHLGTEIPDAAIKADQVLNILVKDEYDTQAE